MKNLELVLRIAQQRHQFVHALQSENTAEFFERVNFADGARGAVGIYFFVCHDNFSLIETSCAETLASISSYIASFSFSA